MRVIKNAGTDRVIDQLVTWIKPECKVDLITSTFSLFAFENLRSKLKNVRETRIIVPNDFSSLEILGSEGDRSARNKLTTYWIANQCMKWVDNKVTVKNALAQIPQGLIVIRNKQDEPMIAFSGSLNFSTYGLGLTPGNPFSLIQVSESKDEAFEMGKWFESQWESTPDDSSLADRFIGEIQKISKHRDAAFIYAVILKSIFQRSSQQLDEDTIIKSATGIKNSEVWKRLYRFQRDGVIGAIDKLNRFGGCIIADSVGLGKTFEALAIIKYHELRNDRVLVLCPKRLRENWTLFRVNDKRNFLARDRFNYDVLNHTDLSRYRGSSGDIDLAYVNWGNYDLVVIDESHNFRNKRTNKKGSQSRYQRLMKSIIQSGVKTRVLMLTATPVNNRLADLKNQIAFATEDNDMALIDQGIISINKTTQLAQKQFNQWMNLDELDRTPDKLIEMLGFDYFQILDLLTIARSRKHIEKYYGLKETGDFPERLKPINIKSDVDLKNEFKPISEINNEIRRLHLASYAPLRYVLPHKADDYDQKYSTEIRGGEGFFRQIDREESLIQLMRVNVLKRMESSVVSFALTVERQLQNVNELISRIDAQDDEFEEIDIRDIDIDDPIFESLLVGRKVKVLLKDVDLIRWKQDLIEDRNRLSSLANAARGVNPERDAKLSDLKNVILSKVKNPINEGNKKVLIFTAFADTAIYLYKQISNWAYDELNINSALVTGSAGNQTTCQGLRKDLSSILSSFSPISKERPDDFSKEGEIDILIATDCISEGQNLQDCDWLINYDIHWNPVRIIQRFGRIDRIGSPNERIQLVNFWPNLELEEYINLEQRVSGRMVLLDISATGEENLMEEQSGNQMNDLEYRRKQLEKLQDTVIDLEDLSSGVSITDLTFTDFRIDLAEYLKNHPEILQEVPYGVFTITQDSNLDLEPGIIFCLKGDEKLVESFHESNYPIAPYFLIHTNESASVFLPYMQAKKILDNLKQVCVGKELPNEEAYKEFNKNTKQGRDMQFANEQLSAAIASIVGKSEERAIESLFSPGGTHTVKGDFTGSNEFEVIAFLVIQNGGAA